MPDPVPEAAVEATAEWFAAFRADSVIPTVTDSDRAYADSALSAALETGTLITVPQDEQGQRELVERTYEQAIAAIPSAPTWLRRSHVGAVLQALGLLPEQEEAK